MTADVGFPLRVGLIGLSRAGWHLLERGLANCPFRVVSVFDSDAANARRAEQFGVRRTESVEQLCSATDIDLIWVSGCDSLDREITAQAIRSGRDVVVESALALRFDDHQELFSVAQKAGSRALLHCSRSDDSDVRKAMQVIQSGRLGQVRSGRWMSWAYGLCPAGVERGASEFCNGSMIRIAEQILHQMLQLMSSSPRRVSAFDSKWPGLSSESRSALALTVEFTDGALGQVELRLDSPVPLQTGWALSGEHAGYSEGRLHVVSADGEVYESPLTTTADDLDSLARLAFELRQPAGASAEFARLQTLVNLLDAVQRSCETRSVIELS